MHVKASVALLLQISLAAVCCSGQYFGTADKYVEQNYYDVPGANYDSAVADLAGYDVVAPNNDNDDTQENSIVADNLLEYVRGKIRQMQADRINETEYGRLQYFDDSNAHLPAEGPYELPIENEFVAQRLSVPANTPNINLPPESGTINRSARVASGVYESAQHMPQNDNEDEDDNDAMSDDDLIASTTGRSGGNEYIEQPLVLLGHHSVQGGAGEGSQLLGPDGIFENVQVIKTDSIVPAYCDPPNPCPIGYTAEQGCIEDFVNSASFSREYQAKQNCQCDNEHSLFNCAAPVKNSDSSASTLASQDNTIDSIEGSDTSEDDQQDTEDRRLTTLARAIQNRYGNLESVRNIIAKHRQQEENAELQRDIVKKSAPDFV